MVKEACEQPKIEAQMSTIPPNGKYEMCCKDILVGTNIAHNFLKKMLKPLHVFTVGILTD